MKARTDAKKVILIVVDAGGGVPVYRQLMDQVRLQIAGEILLPGDELQSTRTLSRKLGINPMTISKAYSLLEKEGVVERRPGRPTVVTTPVQDGLPVARLELLKQSLQHPVTMIRQLNIDPEQALETLREMLRPDRSDPVRTNEQRQRKRSS
jgi:GntR family transcriptional regulator